MKLKDLLKNSTHQSTNESTQNIDVTSISIDSRECKKDGMFVAIKGYAADGHLFIPEALKNGASVIVKDKSTSVDLPKDVCVINVDNPKAFLKEVAAQFYSIKSDKFRIIGVTGTNGKTTVTYLVESILKANDKKTGVVGTINYRIEDEISLSCNTTPHLIKNYEFLDTLIQRNIDCAVMEVSSHALDQGRVDGIPFDVAVLTNLTSDHLDYHLDEESYFKAKAKLFSSLKQTSVSIINMDDQSADKFIESTKSKVLTFGIVSQADFMATDIQASLLGSRFTLSFPEGSIAVRSKLIGMHNIYNILAAAALGYSEEVDISLIQKGIEALENIPGRLERIDCGQNFFVFVDYAHTEDGLRNVLEGIRAVSSHKIIVVFGCGGDRDKRKRPKMGQVASQLADYCVLTNDNPRGEDPKIIIDEIVPGIENDKYTIVPDRKDAIEFAISEAKEGDIVLIAGKGHEDYQIFEETTIHFDDREIARETLMAKK